jgi:transcriptional antiterminator RfaH
MERHQRYADWYLVQAHPAKETLAKTMLTNQGFTVYVPQYMKEFPKAKSRLAPLFTGYLFVQFDVRRDRWPCIHSTFGVKRLFSFDPNRPILLPLGMVENLMRQHTADEATGLPLIAAGCRVGVVRGPMALFEQNIGICQWSEESRVGLLMRVMNREIEITFSRDDVIEMTD